MHNKFQISPLQCHPCGFSSNIQSILRHLCPKSGTLNSVLNIAALRMVSQKPSGPVLWKAHRGSHLTLSEGNSPSKDFPVLCCSQPPPSSSSQYSLTGYLVRPNISGTFPPQDLCTSCSHLLEPLPISSCLAHPFLLALSLPCHQFNGDHIIYPCQPFSLSFVSIALVSDISPSCFLFLVHL